MTDLMFAILIIGTPVLLYYVISSIRRYPVCEIPHQVCNALDRHPR
jgi:hypothetical protein